MKTALTVEESARLIELGVDPKMASMVSWKQTQNWERKSVLPNKEHLSSKPFEPIVMGFERFEVKDVFTLADILSILPKEIGHMRILTINSTDTLYFAFYAHWEKEYMDSCEEKVIHGINDKAFSAPELIDALYELLIWCLEQKIIKLKEYETSIPADTI